MKIGFALGGGGAKGFAHIGVIKVLEENGKSKYDAIKRQNALYTFIKMVELLMGQQIFSCNSQDSL